VAWFLVKSDPDEYSFNDLEKDGTTVWDGVHSFAAIGHIKAMKPGDLVLVYHSQTSKAIVGLAEVVNHPFLNTKDPRFSWAVELKFERSFTTPMPLHVMKAAPELQDFMLVKQSRLSVMPVPLSTIKWIASRTPELTDLL
jgi:predicted RNA-binding protein with PUA-like domain